MSNLIGKTIGAYRILEQIGVGGMATVYKAYQPGVDRYAAIKVLPHYLTQDEQFVKRFQREAKATAQLEHPHILPIYDYGESDGVTYIAMRYVGAGTLKGHMARGPLPLDEISRLIGQIGDALDYAHRAGIIHRDIKPSNVLIDDRGNTYLTDFGLARMMEASDQLTGSGVGVGTPAYMSPEQGQGAKVDHRSDIYSLGVVLYEMVAGHVPYEAETPMAVMLKHITEPLPLPRRLDPRVPEDVQRVILKALAKDPADRYQTAGELAQALNQAVQLGAPAAPRPAPVSGRASFAEGLGRLWRQPSGKAILIGGLVVVAALSALLLSRPPDGAQVAGGPATVDAAATESVKAIATEQSGFFATQAPQPTVRPSATRAPTRKPTAAPAPRLTPSDGALPDITGAILTLDDLPAGFQEMPLDQAGLSKEALSQGDFQVESLFAYLDSSAFQIVLGFTLLIPDQLERAGFDMALRNPDFLLNLLAGSMGDVDVIEKEALPGMDDIADASAGLMVVAEVSGIEMRMDLAVFRRGVAGAFVLVMYVEGQTPTFTVRDAALSLERRLAEVVPDDE